MAKIKIDGLEELQNVLKKNATLDLVKEVVYDNGRELKEKISDNADFRGHYEGKKFVPPTGTTKREVGLEITDRGFTAESGTTTEYAPYLEYGTRFMEAQSFIKPAYDAQKKIFEADMKKLVR